MKIEKMIVFVGKEKTEENYQLLIRTSYNSIYFTPSEGNHENFIKLVSEEFANRIVSSDLSSRLDILNGFRLYNGKLIRVDKLPDTKLLETELVKAITKLSEGRAVATIPIAQIIN